MVALQVVAAAGVGLLALAVVLNRDPLRQQVTWSVYGLVLVGFFVVLQAPDVALSELVVSAVAYPFVVLLTLARIRRRER
jgi:energy-converting hydrogenase B subunit D